MKNKARIAHDVAIEVGDLWDRMRAGLGGKAHGPLLTSCILLAVSQPKELLAMRVSVASAEALDLMPDLIKAAETQTLPWAPAKKTKGPKVPPIDATVDDDELLDESGGQGRGRRGKGR